VFSLIVDLLQNLLVQLCSYVVSYILVFAIAFYLYGANVNVNADAVCARVGRWHIGPSSGHAELEKFDELRNDCVCSILPK